MAEQDTSNEEVVDLFNLDNGDPLAPVDEGDVDGKGAAAAAKPEADNVPDKFKNKTFEEAVTMYTNLETAYGRQGNELGEMKSLADQILKNQVAAAATQEKPVDADTLLENPTKVINDLVAQHPAIQEMAGRVVSTQQAMTIEALERKHGSLTEFAADGGFQNWVRAAPSRLKRFAAADGGDLDEADDLLTTYKEIKALRAPSADASKQAQASQRKALATPSAGSGSSPSALNESGSRKLVFSRQQLMQLKFKDPVRYEAMQPQIMAAYRDGRVR